MSKLKGLPVILVIADAFDTHANVVSDHLRDLGERFFRLNLDVESLKRTILDFSGDSWSISQDGFTLLSEDVYAVWPRRLTVSLTLEQQTCPETSSFRLWRSEWNRNLYGFYSALRNRFWMNSIYNSSLADNKYYQFFVARNIGFSIPEIITSNDKLKLKKFCKGADVAIKFMTQDIFKTEDGSFSGIYVNKLSLFDLEDFAELGENPITLQKYVHKDYEVRHTYVAGKHFSCKIESQMSPRANVDWRRYDVAHTPHSRITAPDHIVTKIEELMFSLGLTYGAFDFIVDKAGKWWYLEVNSAGQWLWIEDLLDMPISASVAQALSAQNRSR